MNKNLITKIFAFIAAVAVMACSGHKAENAEEPQSEPMIELKGDSTVYGLVCDGCTDSVLVMLPADMSDPIKYDIIDAFQAHNVFGKMRIGDRVAILLDPTDRQVVQQVVNLDDLKGTWSYEVMPQFRDIASMSKRMQRRMMQNMPDSVKRTFLVPRRYGFTLKRENIATPVGLMPHENALDDESPVAYPEVPFYTEWHLWNGKLLLVRHDHMGPAPSKDHARIDTAQILMLRPDTLVLQFAGHVQGYSHTTEKR